jgi:NAD(P)H-quinone oxidoreductase subunit 5
MSLANAPHSLAIPLVPLLAGCLARFAPGIAHRLVTPALAVGCILAVFAKPETNALARLDMLATTMAVLVSFIGAVVLRFATRYLDGDPARARFLSWMCLTLAAVLTLVVSNHLLLLLGAWTATSLCLHRLLLHHPHRAGAVFAARKKFVFSRIAECSLLAAALLLHAGHDTWRIDELATSIAAGNHSGLPAAAFLLAFCAMLKSAQFPFHSWLPDTMDTPTPVSALMHAGIVNAGGFLIIRLAPVFAAAPAAMHLLAVVGTFTAVFGAIVMLAQPAVKRSLAFSTIAQMGFMMIQCGLGAWGLALLHLVAHSLYKAHAFLRAGSAVSATPRAAIPLATPALAVGFISACIIVTGLALALKPLAPDTTASPVFLAIVAFALAYGIGRAWSGHARSLPLALAFATGVGTLACALHLTAAGFLTLPAPPPAPVWLTAIVGIAFATLFLFQALLWRASAHPLGRRLYVHALNGFYVGPIANRLLNRLWPTQPLA